MNNDLEPLTKDDVQALVHKLIDHAEDYIESEFSQEREENWLYYYGASAIPTQEGRHTITMGKVRSQIRTIEPALLRPFAYEPNAVEFCPRTPSSAQMAEDMTAGVRYWFYARNEGYKLLANGIREAAVGDSCVLKVEWDPNPVVLTHHMTVTIEELQAIVSSAGPDFKVIESEPINVTQQPKVRALVEETMSNGWLRFTQVPLEDFLIDSHATGIEDARIHGQKEEISLSEAIQRGIPREEALRGLGEDTRHEAEQNAKRNIGTDYDLSSNTGYDDHVPIVLYEVYTELDPDRKDQPQMYRCISIGETGAVLHSYTPVDESPYAIGVLIPVPNHPFGESLADTLKPDQNASTSVTREMLDNLQLSNRPGKEIVEGMVNIDDLMNTELGAIIRTRAPNMIKDMTVPFVAGQSLPILQYLDEQTDLKVGTSRAAMGFSPDMLQSTTKAAVDAANQAGQGQGDYMARNFAETCLKPLFRRAAKLLAQNMDRPFWARITDRMVQVDPRGWDLDVDLEVNVGLGTGQKDEKRAVLQGVLSLQKEILVSRGVQNGMVSVQQFTNTIADILATVGMRNPARYFGPIDEQTEQKMAQMEAQKASQAKGGDPTAGLIEAEKIKLQGTLAKLKQEGLLERDKLRLEATLRALENAKEDDLERDKMLQNLIIDAADIAGKYNTQVNIEQIRAEQAASTPNGPMQ